MKLNYFPDTDSLFIDLSQRPRVESREVSEGVVLNYDAEGNLAESILTGEPKLDLRELVTSHIPLVASGRGDSLARGRSVGYGAAVFASQGRRSRLSPSLLRKCFGTPRAKEDRGLNEAWSAAKSAMPSPALPQLTLRQREWLEYRDGGGPRARKASSPEKRRANGAK